MRNLCIFFLLLATAFAFADGEGHSKHGTAFDSGMRTKPWVMRGIGTAPFPITTKNPEVQKFFNQGNLLLHSFWFEEAERSFRWCLKLEPDNAMAYWGLARCGFSWFGMMAPSFEGKEFERYHTFLKEAVKRKLTVTERERMYIEAFEHATAPSKDDHMVTLNNDLKKLVAAYPDDLEAKAMLALHGIGKETPEAVEKLVQEVLAKNPMHPGAHHASIHNWDGVNSIKAIRSCEKYGRSAPGIGHALHMPGHIYTKIGMWHEAAICMDSATRTELRYMNDRLALPFETWNYPHNRNYLCYIQEQLGMAEASLRGARDMLAAPRDPEYNDGPFGVLSGQGRDALIRGLVKFERWDEILRPGVVEWDTSMDFGKLEKAYTETLALTGLGRFAEARAKLPEIEQLVDKVDPAEKDKPRSTTSMGSLILNMVNGNLLLAEDKVVEGREALAKAAAAEQAMRNEHMFPNDPPSQPWPIHRLLGDDYLKRGEAKLAIASYNIALKNEPNDGFTLSGLARAWFALGERDRATTYAGELAYVWSLADKNLKWKKSVDALGLNAAPIADTPEVERPYVPSKLNHFGPMNWEPFAAPKLSVTGKDGKQVSLENYRGKNVILVFFLGDACVHCVGQLKSLNDRAKEFSALNTVILGVCSQTPQSLRDSAALGQEAITFLSDRNHQNARRFASYDDFEDMELHSTILIDPQGKVRWKRTGGDPFTNIDFLLGEVKRVNAAK